MIVSRIVMVAAALLLAFFCYRIAIYCGNKKGWAASSEKKDAEKFLYHEIGLFYASISNVGAMISFYVMVVGNLLMTFGWGSVLFFASLGGVTFSLFILWWRLVVFEAQRKDKIRTIVDHVQDQGFFWSAVFLATLMLIFSVSTIGSEIQAIGILDQALSSNDGHLIGAFKSNEFRINIFVLLSCIVYVLRGGYMGVIYTDVLQFALIAFFWFLCITPLMHYDLVALIKMHFLINSTTILTALATVILIFGWIMGSCDTWIRTVGMSGKDPSDSKNLVSNRRRITIILLLTWSVALVTIAIPSLAGLLLRDAVQCAYGYDSTEAGRRLIESFGSLGDLIQKVRPLVGDSHNLLAPSAMDGSIPYDKYTNFTNFPFDVLGYMVRDYAQHIKSPGEMTKAMFIGGLGIMAILSAALTTVDSLMILAGQLLYELGQRCKDGKHLRWLANPWWLVAFFGVSTLLFSILPVYSNKAYLSIGVFAWASMVFLGMSTFFITLLKKPRDIEKVVTYQFYVFILWAVAIVLPHLVLVFQLTNVEHTGIGLFQRIILPRRVMPLTAILLSVFTGVVTLVAARKRDKITNSKVQKS